MMSKRILVLLLTFGVFLTGCHSKMYDQTETNVAEVVENTKNAKRMSDNSAKPVPPLVVNKGVYVDTTPINLAKDPTWLKNKIILRGDQLPFSYYSRTIANGGGKSILTHYQVGLEQNAPVSINYSGTVRGALDLLAAKTGYVYTVHGCDVYWQAFVTKTFDIAFMPGSSDYMMGKAGGGSGGTVNPGSPAPSGSSAGGGTPATITGLIDDSSASQYSNLKGSLSVWRDLKESISQMLSPDGKVMVSESTTTVTVRDRPTNVNLIGQFINNLNKNLSKQVLVKVEVLDVSLSSAFNYGIDWTAVKRTLGSRFLLNANFGTPVSITPLVATPYSLTSPGSSGPPQYGVFNEFNSSTGVTALVQALTQQGKISVVTQPRVVCLNNQVSVIRIVAQQGYLASVQTTSVAGGATGAATVTSQVTPGSVMTGLTLYILPKIMKDKVYLQVNADLSNLVNIQPISSQGNGVGQAGGTAPLIQVPNVNQKQFNQRAVIGSGSTLILSGFKQVSNQTGAMQLFNMQDLGGQAAQQENTETIVLITPIILHGTA